MTVQEALQNIDAVVADIKMNRQNHAALQESISIVAERCQLADKFEQAAEAVKPPKKEEKKNGTTDKPTKLPRANKKNS